MARKQLKPAAIVSATRIVHVLVFSKNEYLCFSQNNTSTGVFTDLSETSVRKNFSS